MALRYQLPAMNAIAAAHIEAALAREFGVEWVPREDGAGNEIRGVAQEIIDEFSRRQEAVNTDLRELSRLHEQRYGRAPNRQELMWLKDLAWANTRDGKPEAELDWDGHCADLNAQVGGKLGRVAHGVSRSLRGPDASVAPDAVRGAELSIDQRAVVGAKALARVHQQRATFSRADLLKAISAELPPSSRRMAPAALVSLVCDLADRAIAGEFGAVLAREAPEWPAQPDYLRRAIDGRSVYTRPGADRYASGV
jgi:hypothetical protein